MGVNQTGLGLAALAGVWLATASSTVASAALIIGTDYSDDYASSTKWTGDKLESSNATHSTGVGGYLGMSSASPGDGSVVGYVTYKFDSTAKTSATEATITVNLYRGRNAGIRVMTSPDNSTWATLVDNFSTGGNSGPGNSPYEVTTDVAAGDDLYLRFEVYDNPNGLHADQPFGYVNDVNVDFIPEPSSMLILGGSGLAFLSARRRQ